MLVWLGRWEDGGARTVRGVVAEVVEMVGALAAGEGSGWGNGVFRGDIGGGDDTKVGSGFGGGCDARVGGGSASGDGAEGDSRRGLVHKWRRQGVGGR